MGHVTILRYLDDVPALFRFMAERGARAGDSVPDGKRVGCLVGSVCDGKLLGHRRRVQIHQVR